jgi:hypothetical protein
MELHLVLHGETEEDKEAKLILEKMIEFLEKEFKEKYDIKQIQRALRAADAFLDTI